jgi:hypothetical protein
MNPCDKTNRREMCRNGLRWLALGGITVLSAGLVHQGAGAGDCQRATACGDCSQRDGCQLPQARAARKRGP